jgi:hypothetical protein
MALRLSGRGTIHALTVFGRAAKRPRRPTGALTAVWVNIWVNMSPL